MTALDDRFAAPLSQPNPAAVAPRKCRRHDWVLDKADPMYEGMYPAWMCRQVCAHCGKPKDAARTRTNHNNAKRGNRTSRDLASFLGAQWEDVERKHLPWDVQGAARIQSKREARQPGVARVLGLLRYIPPSEHLRAVFFVGAGQRLASGRIFAILEEYVAERGWSLPTDARLLLAGDTALVELPLPTFRDLFSGGETK